MKTIKKKIKIPRKLSLVKFDFEKFSKLSEVYYYPFKKGESYLFLGEIPNMPGHCAVAEDGGVVYFGYHTDDFIELKESEV